MKTLVKKNSLKLVCDKGGRMSSELVGQEWYQVLIEDCRAIYVEAVFTSRWALVEGHWLLGQRIREDDNIKKLNSNKKYTKELTKLLSGLAVKIKVSESDLWRSLSFYDKYPDINKLPEGKNITWNKIVTKYLPLPKSNLIELSEEQKSKFQNKVILGDCLIELKKIPDKSIDMIYVDPPYNVGKDEWDTFDNIEFTSFMYKWIEECLRVLKDKSHFFIHFPSQKAAWLENLINEEFKIKPVSRIIWHYRNLVQGRNVASRLISTYQPILHYNIGNKYLNFNDDWSDEMYDVWTITSPQSNFSEGKFHPTQKPLELLDRLVRIGSKEGEIVLDPMAGSGTTAIACQKLDRDFIVIEKNEDYYKTIIRRLNGDI